MANPRQLCIDPRELLLVGSYPGPRCAKTLAANGTEYVRFKAKRCSGNINIQPGAYFDIDLAKPPFSMLPDMMYLIPGPVCGERTLATAQKLSERTNRARIISICPLHNIVGV